MAAGQLVKKTVEKLKGFWNSVARAVSKLVGKVFDRVGSLLGKDKADQLKAWIDKFVEPGYLLGRALEVDTLKDTARQAVPGNQGGAKTAVAVVARHAGDLMAGSTIGGDDPCRDTAVEAVPGGSAAGPGSGANHGAMARQSRRRRPAVPSGRAAQGARVGARLAAGGPGRLGHGFAVGADGGR